MTADDSILTLVGERIAEEGREFVYRGDAPACEGCPYRDQCLTLTEGRRYRIVEVRDGAPTLDCDVHREGVVAVEVDPAPIEANVPADRAYAGNRTSLAGPCPHTGCPSHELCEPEGAHFETEYRIDSVDGDPPHEHCALDRDLTKVTFAPPEAEK